MGFVAIGKLDTGFDPASGETRRRLRQLGPATTAKRFRRRHGNMRRQPLRSGFQRRRLMAGLSNATYGTLTVGRQNSLMNDGVGTYDPKHASYAFSLIGFSGGAAAGIGTTETARWDNSVKYIYQYGPVHAAVCTAAAITAPRSGATPTAATWAAPTRASRSTVSTPRKTAQLARVAWLYPVNPGLANDRRRDHSSLVLVSISTQACGTITDNEAYSVMGKYTFDLGGGFKDEGPSLEADVLRRLSSIWT